MKKSSKMTKKYLKLSAICCIINIVACKNAAYEIVKTKKHKCPVRGWGE